jgi:hypothetical protein
MESNLKGSSEAFVEMGFALESAYQVQSALSDATGRQVTLSKNAAVAMSETARITGMLPEEMGTLVGQMMDFGMGAEQSSNFIKDMAVEAGQMGLNASGVIKKLNTNLGLLNKLHFKGGVKALKQMAIFSEKFKIDMQDVAAVADKVFRPEGAIEAAAQLQVLGGSLAALGDPFQLMYKARNAPEELAKSLTKAAAASATWDESTKEWKVNAYELDRLREAATATGMDYSKLVETAKAAKKIGSFEDILKGKFKDQKLLDAVTGMAQMGEKGAFINIVDPDGKAREVLLKDINETQAKTLLADSTKREDLAKKAESLTNQFDAIKNEIMLSLIGVFQKVDWAPIMESLKTVGKAIVSFITWATDFFGPKLLIGIFAGFTLLVSAAFMIAGALFGKMASIPIGASIVTGGAAAAAEIGAAMAGGGGVGVAGNATKGVSQSATTGAAGAGGISKGLNPMDMIKGATAILILSAALFVFAKALQEFDKLKNGWETLAMAGVSMVGLTIGLWAISKIPTQNLIEGAIALALMGAAFIPFAYGLSLLQGLSWEVLGMAGVALIGLTAAVFGLGALMMTGVGAIIFGAGILGFIALGAAMVVLGFGLSTVIDPLSKFMTVIGDGTALLNSGLGFLSMAAGIGILTISLIALGAASLLALPGLLILGGVTSMLTETASALASTGGSEGITKTINAINSVDTGKLEALKELSVWMSLLGATTTIKFEENLHVDGSIDLKGKDGSSMSIDFDKLNASQKAELAQLVFNTTRSERNGGGGSKT